METKVLNNKTIIDARDNIMKAVNAELNNGIPVSVISMILHVCLTNVDEVLAQVISTENNETEPSK